MTAHSNLPPIDDAFEHLHAEPEEAWLYRVFVEPSEYSRIIGIRSTLVIGPRGSGKSALGQFLLRRMKESGAKCLALVWQPRQPSELQSPHNNARDYLAQIIDLTLRTLLVHIGNNPDSFAQAPSWSHDTLYWLLQSYLQGHPQAIAERLQSELPNDSARLIKQILERKPKYPLYTNPSETEIVKELVETVQKFGLESIWIFVDGFENWLDIDQELLAQALQSLLSILSLFEIEGFTIKLLAPSQIETTLMASSGVHRRRLDVVKISWSTEALIKILEKRFALMIGQEEIGLGHITEGNQLLERLQEFGGDIPRGWLEVSRPFIDCYVKKNQLAPLTRTQFDEIARKNPPRLHIDPQFEDVYLGYKKLERVPSGPFKVLKYMLQNHHRFCSRAELYYCALNDEPYELQIGDERYVDPKSWKSSFDNVVHHLRRSLEPIVNSRNSLYIVSERGKGLRLQNVM